MTCDQRDSVAALLLGGLTAVEAVRVEEHLLTCDECAALRRELAIVRTMLDSLDPADRLALADAAGPDAGTTAGTDRLPADLVASAAAPGEAEIAAVTAVRQHRPRPDRRQWRLVAVAAAAAFLLGAVPTALWAATHRGPAARSVELAGTSVAPDAWATVRFLPRTEGTIVDVEAGDLPTSGGRYAVTVSSHDTVLARQEFAVDTDGWAQVVLATTRPVRPGDTVVVERVGDGGPVTVLRCGCTV